jgi:hypothetical protein
MSQRKTVLLVSYNKLQAFRRDQRKGLACLCACRSKRARAQLCLNVQARISCSSTAARSTRT